MRDKGIGNYTELKREYFLKRDSIDKVRLVTIQFMSSGDKFRIRRVTGRVGYSFYEVVPIDVIGYNNASIKYRQVILRYIDSGYKNLSTLTKKHIDELSDSDLIGICPSVNAGHILPMVIKSYKECAESAFNRVNLCYPIFGKQKIVESSDKYKNAAEKMELSGGIITDLVSDIEFSKRAKIIDLETRKAEC